MRFHSTEVHLNPCPVRVSDKEWAFKGVWIAINRKKVIKKDIIMENTNSYSDRLFQLKALCDLYDKYVNGKRIKTAEPQIKHQIGMACSDLYDEFIVLKNNRDSGLLPVGLYVAELKKLMFAIDMFPAINHQKLGTAIIKDEMNKYSIAA